MRIYLTGRIVVEEGGRALVDERTLPGRQGRVAFAYLAAHRDRPVARDELIDALWRGTPPREVDVTFSAVLSRLRAALRQTALNSTSIDVQRGCIHMRFPSTAWIDI